MRGVMEMSMDTPWANTAKIAVTSELDNPSSLTTGELSRLMVYTLSVMVAEVRRENETYLLRDSDEIESKTSHAARERERYAEMERDQAMHSERAAETEAARMAAQETPTS